APPPTTTISEADCPLLPEKQSAMARTKPRKGKPQPPTEAIQAPAPGAVFHQRRGHAARSQPERRRSPGAASPGSSGGHWLLRGLCLLAALGPWLFLEFVVWNRLPAGLVGKWVVQGGEQNGATFDFYRGGTLQGRLNFGGKEALLNASVAVEGERLLV